MQERKNRKEAYLNVTYIKGRKKEKTIMRESGEKKETTKQKKQKIIMNGLYLLTERNELFSRKPAKS
jgi:hypothetical protein